MTDHKLNPYRPTTETNADGLQCPYCFQHFRLTWKLYLQNPTQNQTCPHCKETGTLRTSASYRLVMVIWIVFGLVVSLLSATLLSTWIGWLAYPATFAAFIAVVFELDRRVDERRPFDRLHD